MKIYKILRKQSAENMEYEVNKYLKLGYTLVGGLSVVKGVEKNTYYPFWYIQGVFKDDALEIE